MRIEDVMELYAFQGTCALAGGGKQAQTFVRDAVDTPSVGVSFGALVFRCLGQKRAEAEAGMAVQLGAQ